jgi:dihydrofolate reductase
MKDYECDTFFPAIPTGDLDMVEEKMVPKEVQEEEGVKFEYKVFNRKWPTG